jgi:Tfp pilus assembly protein PilF
MGTAGYMSPEQVRGEKLDARTDIFSFGLVLYEMATGRRAFSADTAAVVQDAILNQAPAPAHEVNSTIPPKLEQIINRAIEKDRELRYPSAAEMQAELQSLGGQPSKRRGRAQWKWLTAVAAICVAVIAAGVYWRSHRPPKLTDKDTIVVGDFDNRTGDSIFEDTLRQGLSLQLRQSSFLDLLSERKVNAALKMMGRSAGDRLTPEVTREICQRTRSKAMVTGSIAEVGSQYVIRVKAADCNMGDALAEVQERAANKEGLLNALDAASISLRSRLGESIASVEKYATPLEKATTPSLEALRAYSQGLKVEYAKGMSAGLPFFKRAIEIDPNFALAYNSLSIAYASQVGRMQENGRKAYELRGTVGERERFAIETNYYKNVTGELEKAAQVFEQWKQRYPRDMMPRANLGVVYCRLGNLDKALEEAREAMRLEANSARIYANLGESYIPLNRLDEAEAVYKQMEERKLVNESLLTDRYLIAFLKGDTAQMAQLAVAGKGKPNEDGLLASQADAEAWYGELKNARELTQRAVDLAEHNDAKDMAAEYRVGAALREVAAGNREQARADTNLAMMLAPNRDVQAIAPLALALVGDVVTAQRLAAELDKAFPLDTLVQRYWLPTIRAAVALQQKDPNRAVELLQVTSAIEFGQAGGGQIYLCPVYLRGEAYLMLRNGHAAAAEFRKFIDHYGLVGNFPWGALARLGLARAYALEAETDPAAREKARTAYQNFLTLWKDADPDTPNYKQAKAEYARLR